MAPDQTPTDPPAPSARLAHLMDGYLTTQLLYVAAKLGVADAIADRPRSAAEIAAIVGAHPFALRRVLRGLAAEGVLDELPGDAFGLTPLGDGLRDDAPGSLRGAIIVRGDLYARAAGGLLDAVRAGGSAFELAYGDHLFDYLARHADLSAAFQASMADRARREAEDVVAAYDFGAFRTLVDVGGGTGVLLARILTATPGLRGVLLDRPLVAEQARGRLRAAGLADRCDVVEGDFFASVPSGGDAYLLSRVIHDWDDEEAVRILAACRHAMAPGATLLLVEAILPERARDNPAAVRMDLHMLMLLHGHERTAADYGLLLSRAGFRPTRVVPTASPVGLGILESVPSPADSSPPTAPRT